MAKSKILFDGASLTFCKPDGAPEISFSLADIHPSLVQSVLAYGAKQIIADAGAVGRNVPDAERLGKMSKRIDGLVNGSWAFRDGFGATPAEPDYVAQFNCLSECAIIPGDDVNRAAWKSMKPAERRAVWQADIAAPARALFESRRPKPTADVSALLSRLGV